MPEKQDKLLKNIIDIFKCISPLVTLGVLIVFHITLLCGNYSIAIERIFWFLYSPDNENIVDLIRTFLANIITSAWVIYCLLYVLRKRSFHKLIYKENKTPTENENNLWATRIHRAEYTIWYTTLIKYLSDILKYYNSDIYEFFAILFCENILRFTVVLFAFIVMVIFIAWVESIEDKGFIK